MANGLTSALAKLSKCHNAPRWARELYSANNEVDAYLTPVEILAVVHFGLRVSRRHIEWALKCKEKGLCNPVTTWVGPLDAVLELTSRLAGGDFNG